MTAETPSRAPRLNARSSLRLVIAFGIVSLFADMTYEGMRSIAGPYLALLAASGLAVGLIGGVGELVSYALRLVTGHWADRSGWYWPITLAGYAVQMIAVPLLALAHSWPAAAALIILERVGKATRNPARNAMLAPAGDHTRSCWHSHWSHQRHAVGDSLKPTRNGRWQAPRLRRQRHVPLRITTRSIRA